MRVATALYGLFSTKCRKHTVLLRVGLFESCYGFLRFLKQNVEMVLLRVGLFAAVPTGRTATFF